MSVESDLAEHLRLFIAQTNDKLAKALSEVSRVHSETLPLGDAVEALSAAEDVPAKIKAWSDIAGKPGKEACNPYVVAPAPDPLAAVNERLERLEGQFKAIDKRINTLWSAVANELAKKL